MIINGGEEGIRTLESLRFTRFPSVRLKPLGHLSLIATLQAQYTVLLKLGKLRDVSYDPFLRLGLLIFLKCS